MNSVNTFTIPTLRVLILEDRAADAELMVAELRRAGFELQYQRVETEADFLANLRDGVQVILADYTLPQFDAPRALRLLQERDLDIPFIVVTGSISEQVAVDVIKRGATDYLLKDRLARLGQSVARALEEKRLRDEQRRADESLRNSEKRFRALVERSSDAIALASPDGTILYVTSGAARIVGSTPEAMIGRNLFQGLDPDDLESARDAFNRAAQTPGSSEACQFRLRRRDGLWRWIEGVVTNLLHEPSVQAMVANYRDITERKHTEESLRESEERFRALYENSLDAILLTSPDGRILAANPEACRIFGCIEEELCQRGRAGVVDATDPRFKVALKERALTGKFRGELMLIRKDGNKFPGEVSAAVYLEKDGDLRTSMVIRDITERKRAEEELRQRAEQLELLYNAGLQLNQALDLRGLIESLLAIMDRAVRADRTDFFRFDPEARTLTFEFGTGYGDDVDLTSIHDVQIAAGDESWLIGVVAKNRAPLYIADVKSDPRWFPIDPSIRSALWMPVEHQGELRGVLIVQSRRLNAFVPADQRLIALFANQLSVAMENARLFNETRQRLTELEAVNRLSVALRAASTLGEMLPILLKETLSVLGAGAATLWLYDDATDELVQVAESGFPHLDSPLKPMRGIAGHVFATGQIHVSPEFRSDPFTEESMRAQVPAKLGGVCVPIRATDRVIGVLFVSVQRPRQLTENEISLLTTLAEIAGNAIHRTRLHEQTEEQLRRLAAQRAIDRAITSSFDLHLTLNVILDQLAAELRVDAADIILLHPLAQTLEYGAARGFRSPGIQSTRVKLGEAYAGRVAIERRAVYVPENLAAGVPPAFRRLLESEGFVSYYGLPLIVKGKVQGVLEIFQRAPLIITPDWERFVETVAEQAAIAVDSAVLFADLEHSKLELMLAYDTTLEGWSHALDLRDRETEGHTQRVTELTLRLARAMGVPEAELVHIRRGALLHDIGKMGVPDRILLKPDQLTEDEWKIMRRHPVHAYEMLMPIQYLQPALDIPYCHHEKWNGAGYPRRLKGEEIPFAARIFAVIDVWDALRSDRPYRPAWSAEKVREYIRSQAGTHFDPRVVEAFLAMIDSDAAA